MEDSTKIINSKIHFLGGGVEEKRMSEYIAIKDVILLVVHFEK